MPGPLSFETNRGQKPTAEKILVDVIGVSADIKVV